MAKRRRYLALIGVTLVLVAVAALAIQNSFASASHQTTPTTPNSTVTVPTGAFDPASNGVPSCIAGYQVLAVITSDNTACVGPDVKRLVMLTDEPTIDGTINSSQNDAVNREAVRLGLADYVKGGIEWVGPAVTAQRVIAEQQKWNQAVAAAGFCVRTRPIPSPLETPTPTH